MCLEAGLFEVGDSIICVVVELDAIGSTQTIRPREGEKLLG